MIRLHRLVGLAGVHDEELPLASKCSYLLERIRMLIIVCLAVQWHMDVRGDLTAAYSLIIYWVVWLFFVLQTILILSLTKDKMRYCRQNWAVFLFIIVGVPFVLNLVPPINQYANFRLILIGWLLIPWIDVCRESLSDNRLGTTLLSALAIVILSGVLLSGIDPNIPTAWDGIWWAWVTASTVGYGDVVPVSGVGRVFAALLILMGLALFAVLTANFSAYFVGRGVREVKRENAEILAIVEQLHAVKFEEDAILQILRDIQKRLDSMELKK